MSIRPTSIELPVVVLHPDVLTSLVFQGRVPALAVVVPMAPCFVLVESGESIEELLHISRWTPDFQVEMLVFLIPTDISQQAASSCTRQAREPLLVRLVLISLVDVLVARESKRGV